MSSRVIFLLGAGASVPADVPHARKFYSDFRAHLAFSQQLDPALFAALESLEIAWEKSQGRQLEDIERLYELLTQINDQLISSLPLQLPDGFPPRARALELLAWELKKFVQGRCLAVGPRDVRYLRPLLGFLRFGKPLTILTLNYDACVELVLDEAGRLWTDGAPFDNAEFFAADLRFPANSDVHLVKLHGSATWYQTRFDEEPGWMKRTRARSQVGISRKLGIARTLTHEAMMIYPTLHKALTNGPFPSLVRVAQRALGSGELCLAIGYSFGDVHVRRLVLEAMAFNPALRVVLVNPDPMPALEALYREAGPDLHRRIGAVANRPDEFGRIEKSLAGGWLFRRSEEWLRGAPIVLPFASTWGRSGGPDTPLKSPLKWELRFPIDGGVSGVAHAEGLIYIAQPQRREILALDPGTGSLRTVVRDFDSPRGLAFDLDHSCLYVVSNRYQSRLSGAPWKRGGIGQLWEVEVATGIKRALTHIRLLPTLLKLAAQWGRVRREGYWKHLVGALRWPTSVIVEEPGQSLLFTEARAIRRIDLASGAVSDPIVIPLPFNVVGVALETATILLVADAGVHPNGFGRLMRADLETGAISDVAGGWKGLGSIAVTQARSLALLSFGRSWPKGRVLAIELVSGRVVHSWEGLDSPRHLSVGPCDGEVLVSTRQGIVQLHWR